jgi:hypothetical protein
MTIGPGKEQVHGYKIDQATCLDIGLRLKTQEDDSGGTAERALRVGCTRATRHVIAAFREETGQTTLTTTGDLD